jgi:hypothetical protein
VGYFKLEHKLKELKLYAEVGLTDLRSTGIASLDEWIKIKNGYPIFIGGAPFAGKTELAFELVMNQAILFGKKTFIYCGEGGDIEHIYYELIFKYLKKPYKWCDDKEKLQAEYFISEHFIICDHDIDYTIDSYFKLVTDTERELDIKFDFTIFDPFNDIDEEEETYGGQQHKFINSALKKSRISSKKNSRIDILVTHVADIKAEKDKETNRFYMRAAMPNEWSGGRAWWRRGFLMLLVYRPPSFLKDENGRPYEPNETIIYIQKAKPKGIGRIGECSIFWDWKKNIYYSRNATGQELYSCEKVEYGKIEPNLNFEKQTEIEDPPF